MDEPRSDLAPDGTAEADLKRLLAEAGPRPEVPEEALRAIRGGLETAWQERQERFRADRRRRVLRGAWWAAAALAGLTALGLFQTLRGWSGWQPGGPGAPERPPVLVALGSVEAVFGPVTRESAAGQRNLVTAGENLFAGDVLVSEGTSRARLRLASGHGLRLDHDSRIRLVSEDRLALGGGAIYLESASGERPAPTARTLGVEAAGSLTSEVGTRFEVRLRAVPEGGEALSVRVREGAVITERGATVVRSEAGMQHVLSPAGEVASTTISTFGPDWHWISATAAPFEVEGRTLGAYLDWVAAEEGWRVAFEDPTHAAAASTITLHGTLRDLSPADSVGVMLPAAGFEGTLEGGLLTVRLARR